jgi:hypothetical protein
MPAPLLKWIGELGIVLSHDLVYAGYGIRHGIFHASPDRSQFALKLAWKLGLTADLVDLFRCEAVTLVLGDGTAWHFDDLNDNRPGHDHVSVGSVVLDFTHLVSPQVCGKLIAMGFEATAIKITVIAYTRRICGDKVDQTKRRTNPNNSSALRSMLEDLSSIGREVPHVLLDVDNLLSKTFRQEILESLLPGGPSKDYSGELYLRQEGITKLFYYSSFVHVIWKFCFRYRNNVRFCHLLQLWAFASFECNGQSLFYEVMMDLIQGKYRGEKDKVDGLLQTGANLYTMLSREFMERKRRRPKNKPKVLRSLEQEEGQPAIPPLKVPNLAWVSTTDYRFQVSGPLLLFCSGGGKGQGNCTKSLDSLVHSRIDDLMELVANYWQNKTSPSDMYKIWKDTYFNVGHLKAMHAIHMGALLGILPYSVCQFATVDAGSNGPFNFLRKHSESLSFSAADAKREFSALLRGVHSSGHTSIDSSHLEQYCCFKDRSDRGVIKYDVIFRDLDDGRLQNFFRVRSTKSFPKGRLEYFHHNGWKDFSKVVMPFFGANRENIGLESKLHPYLHGVSHGDSPPRRGNLVYPQDPFI